MKKISFLIAFLFLSSIICFSQDEHFDPLDELGSGYGNRDMEKMQDPEINFPTTKDYEESKKFIKKNDPIILEFFWEITIPNYIIKHEAINLADISQYSQFIYEKEILIKSGAVIHIEKIVPYSEIINN